MKSAKDKKTFFERLTGGGNVDNDDYDDEVSEGLSTETKDNGWIEEDNEEGQLTVDVYQTGEDIIIQTMVAGVRPENLDIAISRDMVTIKGKRERHNHTIPDDNYFYRELYWGTFSRTILLPQEIEPESAEASEKYGLLSLKLPKIDKEKQLKIKVKAG